MQHCAYDWPSWNNPEVTCNGVCPVECGAEESVCWGGSDVNGCEIPSTTCVPMEVAHPTDPNMTCPGWSTCPVDCGEGMKVCDGGEWEGCPMPGYCMPPSYPLTIVDGNVTATKDCETFCFPMCNSDQEWCWGGSDEHGCELPSSCAAPGECPESSTVFSASLIHTGAKGKGKGKGKAMTDKAQNKVKAIAQAKAKKIKEIVNKAKSKTIARTRSSKAKKTKGKRKVQRWGRANAGLLSRKEK